MSIVDAASSGDLKALAKLLRTLPAESILRPDRKQMCCLHHAALAGHTAAVEMIMQATGCCDALESRASTPLLLACGGGHTGASRALIGASACVNHANSRGQSCLMAAAASGSTAVVQLLLEQKACISTTDPAGNTALTCAAKRCKLGVLQLLLDATANVACDGSAIDPLRAAVISVPPGGDAADMNQVVQLLVAAQADPTQSLHAAAASGHVDTIQQLLATKADLNATATADETVLHAAASAAQPAALEYLLQQSGSLLLQRNAKGETALHRACYNPSVGEVVLNGSMSRVDVDGGPDDQCVALMLELAHRDQIEELINAKDRNGFTALHFGAQAARVHCCSLLVTHGKCSVTKLVNAAGCNQTTALMIAIQRGSIELCECLLKASADLQPHEDGSTALHYATDLVCSMPDRMGILNLVIASSSKLLGALDDNGFTALHCATHRGSTEGVSALLEANCEPDVRGSESASLVTPLMIACSHNHEATARLLLEAKASVHCADRNGWGCLHHAAARGVYPNGCVGAVVRAGAAVDGQGLDFLVLTDCMFSRVCSTVTHAKAVATAVTFHHMVGAPLGVFSDLCKQMVAMDATTPLIEAVKNGNRHFTQMLLTEFEATTSIKDGLGNQAIHFAASNADRVLVEILQQHNADVAATNLAGCTPFFVACSYADPDFVTWMLQRVPLHSQSAQVSYQGSKLTTLQFLERYGIRGLRLFWQGQDPESSHRNRSELEYLTSLQPLLEGVLRT